jgi:eukaryotic-like serine/threonine-protein kinase
VRKKLVVIVIAAIVLGLGGVALAYVLIRADTPEGQLDTELAGVTLVTISPPPAPEPPPPPPAVEPSPSEPTTAPAVPEEPPEGPCWTEFGGDPQRTLARTDIELGIPKQKSVWVQAMGQYLEYPPSFCDGVLYQNTFDGRTVALVADTGKILWTWSSGPKASTPAIAGNLLIVSSHDGSVTALGRRSGRPVWRLETSAKVESSPVVVDGIAYFGVTDGRLFAVQAETGRVRWAYDTGGRINSSPSIWGDRICITTYAGSIFCLRRGDGSKLWSTYVSRNSFQYESFYASASTDGSRLYTVARSGKVVALDASSGRIVWTQSTGALTYSTPAIANGRIFVGGFDGSLHAYNAQTGALLWERHVGGRILGPALVVGDLVFFSTLETDTYAARVSTGQVVWHIDVGKYAPGIATNERYYFSLNGLLIAYEGRGRP